MNSSGAEEQFAPLTIWSDDSNANWFEDFSLDEHMKEIAWMNVDICKNCDCCSGGTSKIIFGKEFYNVCRTTFKFINPNDKMLGCVRKLLEIRKNNILSN